jgi:membrane-anchored glycerophosphoryl diester phosphodiesterase (GDPDase)
MLEINQAGLFSIDKNEVIEMLKHLNATLLPIVLFALLVIYLIGSDPNQIGPF